MTRDEILLGLFAREGGYTNDPRDSGGATRFGITEQVARENGYQGPMKDLPLDLARRIYLIRYWHPLRLDDVLMFSPAIAEELFDSAVNCGTGTAGIWLQRSLNALTDGEPLLADGAVGNKTIAALQAFLQRRGDKGVRVLLRALNGLQVCHYITLVERRPKDEAFLFGWLLNRVS